MFFVSGNPMKNITKGRAYRYYKGYPVCTLFSGGKDSTFALHWAVLKGFDVKCLLTIKPQSSESWMFHYPLIELTRLQAKSIGIPHLYYTSSGTKEEVDDLYRGFRQAIKRYGIKGMVTGALLSDYQRMNINMIAEELGLNIYSPLWRKRQDCYMRELVRDGFSFMIISISVYGLPSKFLGKILDNDDIEDIIMRAKIYGFNPAFEGGEAETFVVDAPLFKKVIRITGTPIQINEYNWKYMVKDAWLEDK